MKIFIATIIILMPCSLFAQLNVAYHQSNLPFVGVSYEFKDKLRPEFRLGTDNFFRELSIEGVVTYDIVSNDEYEFYGGLGARVNDFTGLVTPMGVNFYPLTTKNFGLQIELAPIIGDSNILRGSWGIRYRFR